VSPACPSATRRRQRPFSKRSRNGRNMLARKPSLLRLPLRAVMAQQRFRTGKAIIGSAWEVSSVDRHPTACSARPSRSSLPDHLLLLRRLLWLFQNHLPVLPASRRLPWTLSIHRGGAYWRNSVIWA
jgi:hypothetical protein